MNVRFRLEKEKNKKGDEPKIEKEKKNVWFEKETKEGKGLRLVEEIK